MKRGLFGVGRAVVLLLPLLLAACQSLLKPKAAEYEGEPSPAALNPTVGGDPTMKALACDLDHLEKHIEWYGSVTAKIPDVWGQARLTQYRDEFEKTMAAEVENFSFVLNGSESRSDQSFFASATALSFAAQPPAPLVGSVKSDKSAAPNLVPYAGTLSNLTYSNASGLSVASPTLGTFGLTNPGGLTAANLPVGLITPAGSSVPSPPAAVKPIDLGDPSSLVSKTDDVIKRTAPNLTRLDFAGAAGGIGLEPTERLAQKKRYLDFLNQLRRENEGDDTADGPGTSLNLIRIPVSVLPGKKTEIGHAAEITMTLTPVLGEDLLPMTFRNLLTNDIENQLGFPITQILNADKDIKQLLNDDFLRFLHVVTRLGDYQTVINTDWGLRRWRAMIVYLRLQEPDGGDWREAGRDRAALAKYATPEMQEYFIRTLEVPLPVLDVCEPLRCPPVGRAPATNRVVAAGAQQPASPLPSPQQMPTPAGPPTKGLPLPSGTGRSTEWMMYLKNIIPETAPPTGRMTTVPSQPPNNKSIEARAVTNAFAPSRIAFGFDTPSLPFANGLDNRTAFPTSQLPYVYGPEAMFEILVAAQDSLKASIDKQKYAHLPDVQAYLREQTRAAYEFLKQNPEIWIAACSDRLSDAIRSQRWDDVIEIRQQFRRNVGVVTKSEPQAGADLDSYDPLPPASLSVTTGLAWCLIVDAALLNDRLIRDMRETATSKGKPLAGCDHWCPYYLPDPPPECRQAFNEYVKLRWPIHVFALDPYIQEQNVADSLSTRREQQLALAIAFTNGQISARNLTKYTRRLEAEYETISLNRTQVGFSHGDNTFGWRFYPRYQTPDTLSNAEDFIRNQFIGGPTRDQLLRDRRLEPGVRECVAIVMMPSFVPYVSLDTTTNWFPITNPKHKCLDTAQAVKLSRTVQTIKVGQSGVKDACDYRPGEFERLQRRAEQLEARLPMQTQVNPVPILNTYGGFEMFSNGTSDLAPELFGWYGAPGIDPDADQTTLFLVGDHFSPLRTRVIVGNQVIDYRSANQSLLSRQVVQVTFPKGTYSLPTPEGGEVRVHLATPYGVTRELAIPMVTRKPAPRPGISVADAKMLIQYALKDATATKTSGTAPGTAGTTPPAGSPAAPAAGGQQAQPKYVATAVVPDAFKLKWVGLDPTAMTVSDLRVQFVFTVPGTNGQPDSVFVLPCGAGAKAKLTAAAAAPATPTAVPPANNSGEIAIDKGDLQHMAADLLLQKAVQDLAAAGKLSTLTTTQIRVSTVQPPPAPAPGAAKPPPAGADDPNSKSLTRSILTNDQLTITFQQGAYCSGVELQPTTAATFALAPAAGVSIACTVDKDGKVTDFDVASMSLILQPSPLWATIPGNVTVTTGATTVEVTFDARLTGYVLPIETFKGAVKAWLQGGATKIVGATAKDLDQAFAKPLTLTLVINVPNQTAPITVSGAVTVTPKVTPVPSPSGYKLAPGTQADVAFTLADGKLTKVVATTTAVTIQGPVAGAGTEATLTIKGDCAITVATKLKADVVTGKYELSANDAGFGHAVVQWLNANAVGEGQPFENGNKVRDKIPKSLTLQITPAGSSCPIDVGDVAVTAVQTIPPAANGATGK
jgi:hypothetical protein